MDFLHNKSYWYLSNCYKKLTKAAPLRYSKNGEKPCIHQMEDFLKMEKPLITVFIHNQEITTDQYNDIIRFTQLLRNKNGENAVRLLCNKYPLRLQGKITALSSQALAYFYNWNKKGYIRNISLLKEAENAEEKH